MYDVYDYHSTRKEDSLLNRLNLLYLLTFIFITRRNKLIEVIIELFKLNLVIYRNIYMRFKILRLEFHSKRNKIPQEN